MDDTIKKVIGQRINAAMAAKGVSQLELATVLGYTGGTVNTISYYCSGSRVPDHEKLVKIADYLGVSTDYLLGRTPSNVSTDDICIQKVCEYTGLSQKTIETLHKNAKFVGEYGKNIKPLMFDAEKYPGVDLQMIDMINVLVEHSGETSVFIALANFLYSENVRFVDKDGEKLDFLEIQNKEYDSMFPAGAGITLDTALSGIMLQILNGELHGLKEAIHELDKTPIS